MMTRIIIRYSTFELQLELFKVEPCDFENLKVEVAVKSRFESP